MKVLTIQDVHINPKWINESKKCIERICSVAKQEEVSAIIVGGDFLDRQVVASDENNWNDILQMARDLQEAAQVFFVYGTPGHDSPGCYSSFIDIGWKEITIGKSEKIDDLLIMGIPEITPAFIVAQHPELSKAEVIEKQYEIVNDLIEKYYKPLAMSHNGPVHFVSHGHVAGAKFRDDQKPRTSEFMYSEAMLEKIGADFYQFGHIHLPQRFKEIVGGYGGSAHITWNDLNFKPGFDVVDITRTELPSKGFSQTINIDRFDYGEPARKKITIKNLEDVSSMIPQDMKMNGENLWVDIECDKSFAEQFDKVGSLEELHEKFNIGALSKITTNIQHVDNSRVDTEEYEKAHTLEDIYKIFMPDASESMLAKVRELETKVSGDSASEKKRAFQIEYLYLKGTKAGMENGVQEIELDFNDFQTGANIIEGPNGTGKSFTLGFIPPFSEHFPMSLDLKGLFELKDSQIVRRYRDGETVIEQKILIDPTLASPTAKYYMSIDGEALPTCTGLKEPFDRAVSDIFGSIKMFMTCAFRGQKESPKHPSLEKCKEADLRKNFEELAGIDYSGHKAESHETVKSIQRDMELKVNEKQTLESVAENPEEIRGMIAEKETSLSESKEKSEVLKKSAAARESAAEAIKKDQDSNEIVNGSISRLSSDKESIEKEIRDNNQAIFQYKKTLSNAEDIRKELILMEYNLTESLKIQKKITDLQGQFNKDLTAWNQIKAEKDAEIDKITDKGGKIKEELSSCEKQIAALNDFISLKEKEIALINKPCEKCGEIPTASAEDQIKDLKEQILRSQKSKDELEIELKNFAVAREDLLKSYTDVKGSIPDPPKEPEEIEKLKKDLEKITVDHDGMSRKKEEVRELDGTASRMKSLQNEVEKSQLRIDGVNTEIESLKKDLITIDFGLLTALKSKIESGREELSRLSTEIGQISAEAKALRDREVKAVEAVDKIKVIDSELNTAQSDLSEWVRIEEAFSPKGIPALELSMVAPIIARESNRLLSSYGSRFNVEIITQEARKKDMIEKFKILVNDSMASSVKNLTNMSGGQGVWITKALQEAAAKTYSDRSGRKYLFSIMDEADAALDGAAISSFYEMMNNAMDGERKLISVSHSAEAKAVVSNVVDITKFFKGYGE